jgi:hypothetical protein
VKRQITKLMTIMMVSTFIFTMSPKQESKAGILLLPIGIGIWYMIYGAIHNNYGYYILDAGEQGSLNASLEEKYGHLTDNQQIFSNLSLMIENKIPAAAYESKEEIEVKLSKKEIESALGASIINQELKETLEADLL